MSGSRTSLNRNVQTRTNDRFPGVSSRKCVGRTSSVGTRAGRGLPPKSNGKVESIVMSQCDMSM